MAINILQIKARGIRPETKAKLANVWTLFAETTFSKHLIRTHSIIQLQDFLNISQNLASNVFNRLHYIFNFLYQCNWVDVYYVNKVVWFVWFDLRSCRTDTPPSTWWPGPELLLDNVSAKLTRARAALCLKMHITSIVKRAASASTGRLRN